MDFPELSSAARDRIAAAEIEAGAILERRLMLPRAMEMTSKLPWAKAHQVEGDILEIAMKDEARVARRDAAMYLFKAIADEYLTQGTGPEHLEASLRPAGNRSCRRFKTRGTWITTAIERYRAEAFRQRAGRALTIASVSSIDAAKLPATGADVAPEPTSQPSRGEVWEEAHRFGITQTQIEHRAWPNAENNSPGARFRKWLSSQAYRDGTQGDKLIRDAIHGLVSDAKNRSRPS